MITYTHVASPVGKLLLAADDAGLRLIQFPESSHPRQPQADWKRGKHPVLQRTADQLAEYFDGRRQTFDVPLQPEGTPFQRQVWLALAAIPYGATRSYAQLAAAVDRPRASRAVGAANGRNPLPIVLPCHRVIGADGSLTGYGGGLSTKRYLLQLEGVLPRDDVSLSTRPRRAPAGAG